MAKDDKMLSIEEVIELLRQDADAFRRELEKVNSPQELHRQFEQLMERLEQEYPDNLEECGEAKPSEKILSAKQAEKLLRKDIQACVKQFKKTRH